MSKYSQQNENNLGTLTLHFYVHLINALRFDFFVFLDYGVQIDSGFPLRCELRRKRE